MAHAQQSDNAFKQENVTRVRNSVFVGQGTWDLNIGVELKLKLTSQVSLSEGGFFGKKELRENI